MYVSDEIVRLQWFFKAAPNNARSYVFPLGTSPLTSYRYDTRAPHTHTHTHVLLRTGNLKTLFKWNATGNKDAKHLLAGLANELQKCFVRLIIEATNGRSRSLKYHLSFAGSSSADSRRNNKPRSTEAEGQSRRFGSIQALHSQND